VGNEGGGPDLRAISGGRAKTRPFPPTVAEQAAWYLDRGYVPLPIAPRQKAPGEGWNLRTVETARASLDRDWGNSQQNLGIRLGDASDGLVDVDLDCEEVVRIGARFLPRTGMSFGRQSAPRSHAIYRCPGVKTEKFFDPLKPENQEHGTLVEIRGNGCQTVFPGSVHPSGEKVRFENEEPGVPADVRAYELSRAVGRLAAAALLGRYWPRKGRHELQLALAGALLEAHWEDDQVEAFICAVCFLAGDEDREKRKRTVASTRARIDLAEPVTSWPKLAEVLTNTLVDWVKKWLNIRDNVVLVTGDLRKMVTAAERAVAKEGGKDFLSKIYVRGNRLVRVEHASDDHVFVEVPDATLTEIVSTHARWVKASAKGEKHVLPPREVVSALSCRAHWSQLETVTQITDCPILRPDGTVFAEPGYDEATGALYVPSAPYPEVPDKPAREHVAAARELIEDAFGDFPFASPEHLSAAVAAALTPVARSVFTGPAPLFLFEAPDGGTGKDLCARTCGLMGTGKQPASETFTEDVTEMRKRITTHAIEGSRVVLFGNVEGELGGAPLEDALTLEIYSDRILGKNTSWRGPLRTTFYASANNVSIGLTMARRICPVRLDAQSERPDRRLASSFRRTKKQLLDHVRGPEFVIALLILLRAYVVADCPDMKVSTWGSYEEWAEFVIGALRFAGFPDPGATRDELVTRADPRAEYTRQFVTGFAWLVKLSGKALTVKEALDLMQRPGELAEKDDQALEHVEVLRNAACALLHEEEINEIKLGILLRKSAGKVRDGVSIFAAGQHSRLRSTLWNVKTIDVWREMGDTELDGDI